MSNPLCNRNTFSLNRYLKYVGFIIFKFLIVDTRYIKITNLETCKIHFHTYSYHFEPYQFIAVLFFFVLHIFNKASVRYYLYIKVANYYSSNFGHPIIAQEFCICNRYEHIINYKRSGVDIIDRYLLQLKKLFIRILFMRKQ